LGPFRGASGQEMASIARASEEAGSVGSARKAIRSGRVLKETIRHGGGRGVRGLAGAAHLLYNRGCRTCPRSATRSPTLLRIVTYPHPALRYESVPVTRIDDALRAKVRAMFDLMYEHKGVGLAANQVGLPFRFFILNIAADPEQAEKEQVFINPEIVKRHSQIEWEEGCLSFPGLYGKVKRARRVRVRAFDLAGSPIEVEADELLGVAIQHETDHLSGRLHIDHFDQAARAAATGKLKEWEAAFRQEQAEGKVPGDDAIRKQLDDLARGGGPT